MQDLAHLLEETLAGQSGQAWLGALEELADEVGYFQPLSAKHNAAFVDAGKTLLVSFETLQSVQTINDKSHPIGFEMVRKEGWSLLSFFSDGDTWFRDPSIYRYFDRLIDDGFLKILTKSSFTVLDFVDMPQARFQSLRQVRKS